MKILITIVLMFTLIIVYIVMMGNKKNIKLVADYTKEYRMVFIVNSDLKMGKGKVISQCMHGYDGILESLSLFREKDNLLRCWRNSGSAKIILKATEEEMKSLIVNNNYIHHYCVYDAGRTQVPSHSFTVLVFGPEIEDKLIELTKGLKLY
ncbi:PTH2 [Hepatospora eriocheir]|uniref:peptidyl-tRNA hydrolase n=1 Tax=Hepatospora eriocheir TaxID=1081669 RepID=A0A1X0QGD1_9MICR|nr:PTH2 [Hepatospora eriocheir]